MRYLFNLSWGARISRWIICISLTSCVSVKPLQKEMNLLQTELGYEMTTDEYKGPILCDVVLNELGPSNLDYRTGVKRSSQVIIPLLFVNYQGANFQINLGEQSLKKPYREFLRDALLSECNYSSRFNLVAQMPADLPIDSVYILDVRVNSIDTHTNARLSNTLLIWGDDSSWGNGTLEFSQLNSRAAETHLIAVVTLCQGSRCLFQKKYDILNQQKLSSHSYDQYSSVAVSCMDNMAASLSFATKQLAENISQEISLVLQAQNK